MLTKIQSLLAAFGLFLFGLLTAFQLGKQKQKRVHEVQEINEYVETRKRIDEALSNPDLNAADEFLHKRKSERDL